MDDECSIHHCHSLTASVCAAMRCKNPHPAREPKKGFFTFLLDKYLSTATVEMNISTPNPTEFIPSSRALRRRTQPRPTTAVSRVRISIRIFDFGAEKRSESPLHTSAYWLGNPVLGNYIPRCWWTPAACLIYICGCETLRQRRSTLNARRLSSSPLPSQSSQPETDHWQAFTILQLSSPTAKQTEKGRILGTDVCM